MSGISLLTPTYHRDYSHFCMLRESLEAAGCDWPHWVVVQTEDLPLFRRRDWGCQVTLISTADVLPAAVEAARRRVAGYPYRWAKLRRSLNKRFGLFADALRDGWNVQQLIKLEMSSRADADVWVTLDSDVVVCGRLRPEQFRRQDQVALHAISARESHAYNGAYNREARRLLGLEPIAAENDYVAHPFSFSPTVTRALLARLEQRGGKPWQDVLGEGLQPNVLSEFALYGIFAQEVWGMRGLYPLPANHHTRWIHKSNRYDQQRGAAAEKIIRDSFADPAVDYLVVQSAHSFPLDPLLPCLREQLARV